MQVHRTTSEASHMDKQHPSRSGVQPKGETWHTWRHAHQHGPHLTVSHARELALLVPHQARVTVLYFSTAANYGAYTNGRNQTDNRTDPGSNGPKHTYCQAIADSG